VDPQQIDVMEFGLNSD